MKISCANVSCSRRGNEVQTVAAVTQEVRAGARQLRGFTLIEIALCLAIIGFALLAIMVVLPYGLGAQRDNREETVIGQDASMLLELIRSGSRGANDLTNYVYAITNYWTWKNFSSGATASGANGYTFTTYNVSPSTPYTPGAPLTNGANIIGLLSTPQFTDNNGAPIRKLDPAFVVSGYSNHIVAYVRSLSGIAAEKPPQNNDIMRDDSFSYRIYAENAAQDFEVPSLWVAQSYVVGDLVTYPLYGPATYWRAVATGSPATPPTAADTPSSSDKWVQYAYYNHIIAGARRELRLTFRWPVLPTGNTPKGPQTFRASVGQPDVTRTNSSVDQLLYFYQPQTVSAAP